MTLKLKIIELRNSGKTYDQIQEELNCSKGTISYHIGDGQKEKYRKRKIKHRRKQHPFARKLETFKSSKPSIRQLKNTNKVKKQIQLKLETFFRDRKNKMKYQKPTFTIEDVINKFGENPECYLTGDPINIYEPKTYHFDHIIPVSKGGENTLDNLGICTAQANFVKSDLRLSELLSICEKILKKHSKKD